MWQGLKESIQNIVNKELARTSIIVLLLAFIIYVLYGQLQKETTKRELDWDEQMVEVKTKLNTLEAKYMNCYGEQNQMMLEVIKENNEHWKEVSKKLD